MSTQPDGGPAFPQPNHLIDTDRGRQEAMLWMSQTGMSLLDYYFGKALEGIMFVQQKPTLNQSSSTTRTHGRVADHLASPPHHPPMRRRESSEEGINPTCEPCLQVQPARPSAEGVGPMTLNKVTPMSFDFGGDAIRPDYVVKCSYGNDSIALLQFLHEYNQKHTLGKVVVLYNDTGWATKWWPARVDNAEKNLVRKMGFIPCRTESVGMEKAIWNHNGWPDEMRKFCTSELKIIPTHGWLRQHDPEGKAVMVCGVRREESHKRRLWPEWVESSEMDEGRSSWSPLVLHTKEDRDELIRRAGFEPLPHRSRECRCINANSTDLKTWSEDDIADVERIERRMSEANPGKIKFMFHPAAKKGRPEGIRAVVEWAHGVKKPDQTDVGCDSGYCSG